MRAWRLISANSSAKTSSEIGLAVTRLHIPNSNLKALLAQLRRRFETIQAEGRIIRRENWRSIYGNQNALAKDLPEISTPAKRGR